MPHALLLSPDDQAVNAISGVLEEMSVTFERPLDAVSAAQKLNSRSFDLVLVDCENLPAAKLIFDVCRRGNNGQSPVPIAIVDGRAGLPTAFRLGAELILTKPVAKDQARSTIRTAVGRVRKDVASNESVSAQPASQAGSEPNAQAATAASSQLTSFAEPAPSYYVPGPLPSASLTTAPNAASTATLSAPAVTMNMKSTVDDDEIDAIPANPISMPPSASLAASSVSESSSTQATAVSSKAVRPFIPSDDPVLAELERTEQEESERAEAQKQSAGLDSVPDKAAPDKSAAKSDAPVLSSYQQGPRKSRGSLFALLMLVLAGGGFYAAWTYQPGFRDIAQPQIDRVLALVGMAPRAVTPTNPAKPSARMAPATAAAPAPALPTDSNTIPTTTPDSATGSTTGSKTTSAAATAPAQVSPMPGKAVAPSASGNITATATPLAKSETSKSSLSKASDSNSSDTKKDAVAATSSNTPLPGENSAIILSSKGAEKRLGYSLAPKYPVEARSEGAEGTVVLKAVVDENGKVEGLRLVEGNATLATAAIQAVKQWRYRPYVRDGKAQSFQTVVIVDFQRP